MSGSRQWGTGSSGRHFLQGAAGVTAGIVLPQRPLWAQGADAALDPALTKIDPQRMITSAQALDWNMFKAQGGPTYAGSVGWKRFTDFLVIKMQEYGAVDFETIEIPYDHYIVDDWPDR